MIQAIKKIKILAAGLLFLSSCDLNLVPEANLSDEVYWKTDQDFRQALNYLYKAIEIPSTDKDAYPLFMDVLSDNAVSSGFNSISNGSYIPGSNFGPWDRDYRIIRAANNILEHTARFYIPVYAALYRGS
jgi:hypothetical protein